MDDIKWIKTESFEKPEDHYVNGDGTIFVSKDVKKKTRFDEVTKTNVEYYEYFITWMTKSQFEMHELENRTRDLEDMILELSEEVYK